MRDKILSYITIFAIMCFAMLLGISVVIPMGKMTYNSLFVHDEEIKKQAEEEVLNNIDAVMSPIYAPIDFAVELKKAEQDRWNKALEDGYIVYLDGQEVDVNTLVLTEYKFVIDDELKIIKGTKKRGFLAKLLGL